MRGRGAARARAGAEHALEVLVEGSPVPGLLAGLEHLLGRLPPDVLHRRPLEALPLAGAAEVGAGQHQVVQRGVLAGHVAAGQQRRGSRSEGNKYVRIMRHYSIDMLLIFLSSTLNRYYY